ncbi:hypothetical protein VNO80_16145 [Phaseolus coccineus]|uniref:DUF3730 domain-containing protein n=1 Tax=Phaseolus coccineus TaxID=3886 RepID=A0AAN9ML69_PHACN
MTRVPQPGLQKLAVQSIFSKLRSAPKHLDPESEPGRRAIFLCLNSPSPHVVDHSVRLLCRLATDSVVAVARASLELQAALEGSDPKFVPVFVKGLGFLARHDFRNNASAHSASYSSSQTHPFVRVLLCRPEVQSELLQQIVSFGVIHFLVCHATVSSMVTFCCSFPHESMPVFKLLIECLKYLPHEGSEDYRKLIFIVEHMVEAYIVVLKSLAGKKSLITEAQLCAVEFLETILSLSTCLQWHPGGHEPVCELFMRLLTVQKYIGLAWLPGLSSTIVSLFIIIVQSELEHEQISILKLLLLILKWKYDSDAAICGTEFSLLFEETLFLLPILSLMSSPSKSVKGLATDLLHPLEKLLANMFVAPKDKLILEEGVHYLSKPGIIVFRLLCHLCAVLNVLMIHPSMGAASVDSLSSIAIMDPKLGVPLLLTIMFYSNIFRRNDVNCHDMLSCIENKDRVIKALGLQSLAFPCEADVIDFYTAWDVIAEHVQGYKDDPILAHSLCLLLRWGAMDAEAYSEASKSVLAIVWNVSQLENSIPDFKKMILELFFSETNPNVLKAMEDFHVKIIAYEHIIQRLRDVHTGYEIALVEVAASLQLSRNILLALMALQSWKGFVRRWMKAYTLSFCYMLFVQSMMAVPRAAENIALAIGALCVVLPPSVHTVKSCVNTVFKIIEHVLPPSVHTVKSAASKFLLEWLLQHEHEHRQWSAAISLGLISSCLHVTDYKQRYHNITRLLEVLFDGRSSLVKGACGVGLGFSCQDLLTRVETSVTSTVMKEAEKIPESELLGRIITALATMIQQRTQCSSDVLDSLCSYFPLGSYDISGKAYEQISDNTEDLEEDIWGVAGLVLGLANSICAIFRAGELGTVIKIKNLVISWLPYVHSLVEIKTFQGKESEIVLALGSCIALPTVVAFCQRMELMDDAELDHIVIAFKELISKLISVKKSGILHHSMLMASCAGAGTVLSCILNEGVVNAIGAGAEILINMNFPKYTRQSDYQKESSSVMGLLLSSSDFEPYLTSLAQELFLVAQNSDTQQLQQFASWVLAFLRHHLWSRELLGVDSDSSVAETSSKSVSHSFSEDSVVLKLSLWLMDFKYTESSQVASLDWGSIIMHCMRYEVKVVEFLPKDSTCKNGSLREESTMFAMAHANQFDSLLTFLDELSDFSRLRTLEINLQSCLLNHLADLVKVFSNSRLEKLFGDRCMEVLFTLLPAVQSSVSVVSGDVSSAEEWSEAVSHEEFVQSAGKSIKIQKKVCAKVKLVKTGSLSVTELGKMKSYILNSQSQG